MLFDVAHVDLAKFENRFISQYFMEPLQIRENRMTAGNYTKQTKSKKKNVKNFKAFQLSACQ